MAKRKRESAKNPQNLFRAGTAALSKGQIKEARDLLEQAYALDKSNGDIILNLAGSYILSKQFKQAITLLEPLTEQDPNNPMIWTNLGAAYLGNPILAKDENHQKAIAAFKTALYLEPEAPNVAYNLGLIYRDRKEYDQAIYWFEEALQTNPLDKHAESLIAQVSEKLQQPESVEAESDANKEAS
jgi:Flp pilus assembly protein TadD